MQVVFFKRIEKGRISCGWDAVRGKRTRVPGTFMNVGKRIPHDLAQYVIEAASGYEHGFWGLVSKGATFKSTGRRRTRPGRAVIVDHRKELDESEALAGRHSAEWHAGRRTPVTEALDAAFEQWKQLRDGERLVFDWPSPHGTIHHPG